MLQAFPKHQAGWSGTGVNVPAAATSIWSDLVAKKINQIIFTFYFFIWVRNLIFAVLTN